MVSYSNNNFVETVSLEVLILVVVEDGLVLLNISMKQFMHFSLNPCCSGRWSRTLQMETTIISAKS